MDLAIPERYEDVTAEWLDAALRSNGIITEQRVIGVATDPLDAKYGRSSSLAYLRPEYDRDGVGPEIIFSKFVSRIQGNRELVAQADVFRYEIDVYRSLTGNIPLSMPRFYYGDYSDDSDVAVLMIEAVDGANTEDQPAEVRAAGLSSGTQRVALASLAEMYGHWWERVTAEELPWLRNWTHLGASELLALGTISPKLREAMQPYLSASQWAIFDACSGYLKEIDAALSGMPQTLCHGDFHPGNLQWDHLPEATAVTAVVDWQIANRGPAARDLAYFLGGSTSQEAPFGLIHDQVSSFYSCLPAAVQDVYSEQRLLADLVPAILEQIVRFQVFFSVLDFAQPDAAEFAGTVFTRLCKPALELGAEDWLAG